MADDASTIINEAAERRRVHVDPHPRSPRDPNRTIRIVRMRVPPCDRYPRGAELWVNPRQVQQHLRTFPGAFVIDEIVRRPGGRAVHSSGMEPKGHRDPKEFLNGFDVTRS